MKKHILMVTVASLFLGVQVNAMDQKRKEDQFRSFLNHVVFYGEEAPAGENEAQYYTNRMRDGAKLYGLQPALARRIYSDLMVNSGVANALGVAPTDPDFPTHPDFDEIKAQVKKDYGPGIDAAAREIFP